MDTETLTLLLTLAGASMLLVVAMVRCLVALVAEPERPSAVRWWGLTLAAASGVLVVVIVRWALDGGASPRQALAGATLIVGAVSTCQAFWVWLALSIGRTNRRAAGEAVAISPARNKILRRAGRLAVGGSVAVALAGIELGYARALVAVMVAPGHRAIAATLTVAAAGFLLFMFGSLWLVLNRGEPMSRSQIEQDVGRARFAPRGRTGRLGRFGAVYRHFGPAMGAKAEQELSISAMKTAWRTGAWRREPVWQPIFAMVAGGLMMTFGGFSVAVVAGRPAVQMICGGALAYAAFQLVAAVRRA